LVTIKILAKTTRGKQAIKGLSKGGTRSVSLALKGDDVLIMRLKGALAVAAKLKVSQLAASYQVMIDETMTKEGCTHKDYEVSVYE